MLTNSSLHRLFREQAARTPSRNAVICDRRALSFEQLDRLSDSLAISLKDRGVERGSAVGLLLNPSCQFVISYLAVLKAGGYCVPIDDVYPDEFIGEILRRSSAALTITHRHYLDRLDEDVRSLAIVIEDEESWSADTARAATLPTTSPDDWAFISFTSGSTGAPKGVPMSHGSAIHAYTTRYSIRDYDENDRVACNIFFIWEFFRPLLRGASVQVVPNDVIFDPTAITAFIKRHEITEILFTPSLFGRILNAIDVKALKDRFSSLRSIWLNGEVVTAKLRNRALAIIPAHVQLLNTYSICECHDVSDFDLRASFEVEADVCPVGLKREGVTTHLLLEDGKTNTGELCIGGPGLAPGYLASPKLTAERFIKIDDERYYRTGDRAVVSSEGLIQITGRIDLMAKIRGYSIHLGAVETALLKHADIVDCAVVPHGQEGSDKRLVAYVVKSNTAEWTIDPSSGLCPVLRSFLKKKLPHYMLPAAFLEVDALPVSGVTGKIDKRSLPDPPSSAATFFDDLEISRSASIETQKDVMRTIWSRILGQPEDIMDDESNFFDFGGHSLLAVELVLIIEEIFDVKLRVTDIFQYPTINHIVSKMNNIEVVDVVKKHSTDDTSRHKRENTRSFAVARKAQPTKNILVTGSTGFLGSFVVDEIARNSAPDVRLHCLIRQSDHDESQALERQLEGMSDYGIQISSEHAKITPVVGDIRKDKLGLADEKYEKLIAVTDTILHCASLVNLSYPFELLERTIVAGTRNVLEFAKAKQDNPLYHVSSSGIFPDNVKTPFLENDLIEEFEKHLEGGYAQAKWKAEMLVWNAAREGLPAIVFRPGNIGHHSLTGASNAKDMHNLILYACLKTGFAPKQSDWVFESTPVDMITKAIRLRIFENSCPDNVFNVINSDPAEAESLFNAMIRSEMINGYLQKEEWISRLEDIAYETMDAKLLIISESVSDWDQYLRDTRRYDCSSFVRFAAEKDIRRPDDKVYFNRLLSRLSENLVNDTEDDVIIKRSPQNDLAMTTHQLSNH